MFSAKVEIFSNFKIKRKFFFLCNLLFFFVFCNKSLFSSSGGIKTKLGEYSITNSIVFFSCSTETSIRSKSFVRKLYWEKSFKSNNSCRIPLFNFLDNLMVANRESKIVFSFGDDDGYVDESGCVTVSEKLIIYQVVEKLLIVRNQTC